MAKETDQERRQKLKVIVKDVQQTARDMWLHDVSKKHRQALENAGHTCYCITFTHMLLDRLIPCSLWYKDSNGHENKLAVIQYYGEGYNEWIRENYKLVIEYFSFDFVDKKTITLRAWLSKFEPRQDVKPLKEALQKDLRKIFPDKDIEVI